MAENNRTDEMNRMAENIRSDGQNRTAETNRDPAMLSLQSELEAMARETPEMPESFRQAWREAVRKEAAAAQAVQADTAESLSAVPAEQADPAKEPAAAEADLTAEPENQAAAAANSTGAPEGRTDAAAESSAAPARQPASSSRRPRFALWRAALNFAAIALFILGGSILGRESLTLLRSRPVSAALKAESAVQEVSAPKAGTALQADSAQEAETALLAGSASEAETGLKANASPRRDAAPQTGSPLPSSLPTAIPEVFGAAMETANETARYDALPEAEEAEVMEETEVLEEAEVMANAAVPEMAAAGSADRGEAPAAADGAVMNSMDFPPEDAADLSDSAVSSSEDAADADSYVEVGEAVYNSSLSYTAIDDAAVPKAAAVPETEAAEEVMEDTVKEEEAAPAALSALPEESAGEPAEESMEESAREPAEESMEESSEESAEVIPETSDPAVPNSPRTAVWLLGGILIGLAVFCWAFLLSTRKKAPKGGKKAR